jgi:hypothetical protein
MTLATFRTTVHNLAKEQNTDAGALLVADNVLLDYFINAACQTVVLDLAKEVPHLFLAYEDITLIANIQSYTPTKDWLQIMSFNRRVTGKAPYPLQFVPWHSEANLINTGDTDANPAAYTIVGKAIYFIPTPSTATAAYARLWVIEAEADPMVANGPTKIPAVAQHLIPLQAMILISSMMETTIQAWAALYGAALKRVTNLLGSPIQGQPRFLGPSFADTLGSDSREKAFYDKSGFFD